MRTFAVLLAGLWMSLMQGCAWGDCVVIEIMVVDENGESTNYWEQSYLRIRVEVDGVDLHVDSTVPDEGRRFVDGWLVDPAGVYVLLDHEGPTDPPPSLTIEYDSEQWYGRAVIHPDYREKDCAYADEVLVVRRK